MASAPRIDPHSSFQCKAINVLISLNIIFGIAVSKSDNEIITAFYHNWDLHVSTNELLTFVCEQDFIFQHDERILERDSFAYYYEGYIQSHINEKHWIYSVNLTSSILSNATINEYIIYVEYSTLQWNYLRSYTLCNHYNYTVKMNISHQCIQSIHVELIIS